MRPKPVLMLFGLLARVLNHVWAKMDCIEVSLLGIMLMHHPDDSGPFTVGCCNCHKLH